MLKTVLRMLNLTSVSLRTEVPPSQAHAEDTQAGVSIYTTAAVEGKLNTCA
jgi:hypothetical protein